MAGTALPLPHYIDLRFPDGTHTGVRVDWTRGVIEIRKRGVNFYFDIAEEKAKVTVEIPQETCYNFDR